MQQPTYQIFQNKPTQMVLIIAMSPLARIFQPYASIEKYLDDPDLIMVDDSPFKIIVEGSHATREFELNKIYQVTDDEGINLVGIDNDRFTKSYAGSGLVYFHAPRNIISAVNYATETGEKVPEHLEKEMKRYLEEARTRSHERIIGHCKLLYNSMMQSRNVMKENGKAPSAPNDMELLIAFVLREEIKKSQAKRSKLTAAFEEAQKFIEGTHDIENLGV